MSLIRLIIPIAGDVIIVSVYFAIIGSILPDILEPSENGKKYHSKRTLKLTGKILAIIAIISLILITINIIVGFFIGYVSHLLADSTTEAGLPD